MVSLAKNKHINILLIAMVAMMFLMIMGVKKAQSDNTSSAQERIFNVIPIIPQDTEITTTHIGYITPIKSVNVLPNVNGYIQDVLVEGGQKVKTGDVLAIIDQREYDAALKATKASTAKAQADLNNADVYYRRIKKAGSKAISATDLDNAKASYLSALASLEQAKAEQNKAQVVYDYTVLQSTIDGVVGNVDLTPGNYVSPSGGALFSIVQTDPIRVVFSISDKEYLDVLYRQGEKNLFADSQIKLQLANGNIYTPTGKFKFTDNMVDKSTGSISVYADFANPNGDLVSGSYVNVQINKEV
ncbi:MAG: efflux RND transporter periplasmic adaptor subunit, partial [Alphaproteobacteria bacterium]|nr:efflux RND transporter periplasmic adaptor subunit [Alphaproteobacteria bacterium]